MAAVSDGSDNPLADCIDYDLQRHLKGLNTATPDLSTLAQKGDEKVIMEMHMYFINKLEMRRFRFMYSNNLPVRLSRCSGELKEM